MNEIPAPPAPTPVPDGPPSPRVRAPAGPPTPQQRRQRIWDLQAEALARADPLAANVRALSGDLMLLALQLGDGLRDGAAAAADGPRQLFAQTDQYLKVVRQLDRLVHLDQQFAREAPPAESDQEPPSGANGQTPDRPAAAPTPGEGSGPGNGRDASAREHSHF